MIVHQNDTCEIVINHTRYRREIRDVENSNEWKSTDLSLSSSTLYLPIYAQISVNLKKKKLLFALNFDFYPKVLHSFLLFQKNANI